MSAPSERSSEPRDAITDLIQAGFIEGYVKAFEEHVLSRYPAGDYYSDSDAKKYALQAWEERNA